MAWHDEHSVLLWEAVITFPQKNCKKKKKNCWIPKVSGDREQRILPIRCLLWCKHGLFPGNGQCDSWVKMNEKAETWITEESLTLWKQNAKKSGDSLVLYTAVYWNFHSSGNKHSLKTTQHNFYGMDVAVEEMETVRGWAECIICFRGRKEGVFSRLTGACCNSLIETEWDILITPVVKTKGCLGCREGRWDLWSSGWGSFAWGWSL